MVLFLGALGHRAHTVYVGVHVPPGIPTLSGGHRRKSHHRRHRHPRNGDRDEKDDRPGRISPPSFVFVVNS